MRTADCAEEMVTESDFINTESLVAARLMRAIRKAPVPQVSGSAPPAAAAGYADVVTNAGKMTHVDATGAARLVDVSGKDVSARRAVAAGRLVTTPEVVALLRGAGVPKGDALAVARLAGIMGAKRTPDIVPLCHPIGLHGVTVDLTVTDTGVDIEATAKSLSVS